MSKDEPIKRLQKNNKSIMETKSDRKTLVILHIKYGYEFVQYDKNNEK